MMKEITLIYPNQLYNPHPASARDRLHVLVEDPHFFSDPSGSVKFHKQKLMLHRATMKNYENEVLKKQGLHCRYIDFAGASAVSEMLENLKREGLESIHVVDPTDHVVERRLKQFCEAHDIDLMLYETPNFLTPKNEIDRFFENGRHFHMMDFYIHQRKRMGILMESKDKPVGGKWCFENGSKQKVSSGSRVPEIKRFRSNRYVEEARAYVEKNFPDHPGITERFVYPINEDEAKSWLENFLEMRFSDYSKYRDSIFEGRAFAFQGLLSSSLNIGLISPDYILERIDKYIAKHRISIESVEAFVRQIIGWREFIRGAYLNVGEKQRGINFFLHSKRLTPMWYGCDTGIEPLDDTLRRVLQYAYCSCSQRLMVLGNLMIMCEVNPDEIYHWFMEMLIDAYDWSMVPNVYGISQFADGGLISEMPGFYQSADLLKISNYKKGEWCKVWDGLFWRFIDRHKVLFARNRHLSKLVKQRSSMSKERFKKLNAAGESFIQMATR